MKFNLLLSFMVILIVYGTTSADIGDPDPDGIVDTLDLVVTVDWDNNKVIAEAYHFTDYAINGSSIGFTWANSTAELHMDSAVITPLLYPLTIKQLYDNNNIDLPPQKRTVS